MPERKRVLFVLPSLDGGGAERVMTHVIDRIDRSRFSPEIALGLARGRFLDSIDPSIPCHILGSLRARQLAIPLARLIWKLRPDTVVSTLGTNFAIASIKPLLPKRTRIILREGSSPTAFLNDVRRASASRAAFYTLVYNFLYRRADSIVCQSDFMLNDIRSNFSVDSSRLIRIYNPIDTERLGKSEVVYPDSPFDRDRLNLLSVGRLSFEKGHDILLRAFAEIVRKHPSAFLTLVGEGPEHAELSELAQRLNVDARVRFAGFDDNPYRYIAHSDLVILPSRYEGFSNVMAESWACGKPVVATDCPGANREILIEEVNGWLAVNDDPSSLAEKIDLAISKIGTFDRNRIMKSCIERFSMESIIPQYEAEFAR